MNRIITMILGFCLMVGATQAQAVERRLSIFGFDNIRIMGSINVEIVTGKGVSATASADTRRILDRLSLRKSGDELIVSVKPATDGKRHFSINDQITLRLTTYALEKIVHRGSGSVTVDRLTGRNTKARLSGFGTMAIAAVDSDLLAVTMNGGGAVQISGEAKEARVSLLGSSNFDGGALTAENLYLTQRGPASSRVSVERVAEITNAGSGTIEILGKPNCLVRSAGAAEIVCNPKR